MSFKPSRTLLAAAARVLSTAAFSDSALTNLTAPAVAGTFAGKDSGLLNAEGRQTGLALACASCGVNTVPEPETGAVKLAGQSSFRFLASRDRESA